MNNVITFIVKNWYIIIGVCVLILMIIIGYYADSNGLIKKGKKKSKKKEENHFDNKSETIKELDFKDIPAMEPVTIDNELTPDQIETEIPEEDENFEQFETYFEKVLPEKPLISDELKKYMEEFQIVPESLKMNEEKVFNDIRLPEIKNKELDDEYLT